MSRSNRFFFGYSYGFNGMEKDKEIRGEGNSYITEFRQYDPRIGRWLSLDPLMMQFAGSSPHTAFANNPIVYTDPYGLAPKDNGAKYKDIFKNKDVKILKDVTVVYKRTAAQKILGLFKNIGSSVSKGLEKMDSKIDGLMKKGTLAIEDKFHEVFGVGMTSKDGTNKGEQGTHGQKKLFNIDDLVDGLNIGDTPNFKKNKRTDHQATKAKDQLENENLLEDFYEDGKELSEEWEKEQPEGHKSGLKKTTSVELRIQTNKIKDGVIISQPTSKSYKSEKELKKKNPGAFKSQREWWLNN